MPYRTLGDLRGEVLAGLGMGAMGASGGANQALIDSFLRNGQTQLYWLQQWDHLTEYEDSLTQTGETLYDFPTNCLRNRRLLRIECAISGVYGRLKEGIPTGYYSTIGSRSFPMRYERNAQIRLFPEPSEAFTLRIWYVRDLLPFTQNDHVATLDDEMVLLHAKANAKAHYRQPDAKVYGDQLNTLLGQLRGQAFGSNGVYRRDRWGDEECCDPMGIVVSPSGGSASSSSSSGEGQLALQGGGFLVLQ